MKTITLMFSLVLLSGQIWSQETARYTVTFSSNWSQEAHPHPSGSLPASAHWSKLVGVTHKNSISFLTMGEAASPGIEDVAELGNNTAFSNEVNAAITNGFANQYIDGPDLDTALGTVVIPEITTTTEYTYLTLVSMIAPSPDWMIAISGINLLDSEGDWIDEITIDLYPYDAGTDNGADYTSPNMDAIPPGVITSLQGIVPFSSEKIGTVNIQLDEILSTQEFGADTIKISPNPVVDNFSIGQRTNLIKEFTIYNAIGALVMRKQVNGSEASFNVTNLNSGIYLVRIKTTDNQTLVRKLVKR